MFECVAKVRHAVEAPRQRDLSDGACGLRRIEQICVAAVEPQVSYLLAQAAARAFEYFLQIACRAVVLTRDARNGKRRVAQLRVHVSRYALAQGILRRSIAFGLFAV